MAEYGLLWKPGTAIKGNVTLKGYEGCMGCLSANYSSAATMGSDVRAGATVSISSVSLVVHAGAWAAQLLDNIYRTRNLGETTLYQLAQAIDPARQSEPTVIQTIVLANTLLVGFSMEMSGGGDIRMATLTLEFSHFTQTYDKKTAGWAIRNIVDNAV